MNGVFLEELMSMLISVSSLIEFISAASPGENRRRRHPAAVENENGCPLVAASETEREKKKKTRVERNEGDSSVKNSPYSS